MTDRDNARLPNPIESHDDVSSVKGCFDVIALARDISIVDLQFTGRAGIIASAVLDTADGMALVDPGPTTCLSVLRSACERSGRAVADLRAILLTHVHL